MLDFRRIGSYLDFRDVTPLLLVAVAVLLLSKSVLKWCARLGDGRKLPPGPIGLPIVGYLPFLGKTPAKTLRDMSSKYGDVIGLYFGRRYTVVLNKYKTAKEVLSHPAAMDRGPNIFDEVADLGLLFKNGSEWIDQRRFCFSAAKDLGFGTEQYEDFISPGIETFLGELKKTGCRPTDIARLLRISVSLKLISMLVGRKLSKDRDARVLELGLEYPDALFRYASPTGLASMVPGLRTLLRFLRIAGYEHASRIIRDFQGFTKKEVDLHKLSAALTENKDFIHMYLERMDNIGNDANRKRYLTDESLAGNLNLMYIASADTLVSSMQFVVRLLAVHQDVQDKVRAELIEVLGKEGKPRFSERQKLPYTFAVLTETLRFASVTQLPLVRNASEDIEVQGLTIPKGADILANLWAFHNDPEHWDEPDQFRPGRFLSEDGARFLKNLPGFAPFSLGRRKCPGETIAWMGILSYVAGIFLNFRVEPEAGVEPTFESTISLVTSLEPQPLCFKSLS